MNHEAALRRLERNAVSSGLLVSWTRAVRRAANGTASLPEYRALYAETIAENRLLFSSVAPALFERLAEGVVYDEGLPLLLGFPPDRSLPPTVRGNLERLKEMATSSGKPPGFSSRFFDGMTYAEARCADAITLLAFGEDEEARDFRALLYQQSDGRWIPSDFALEAAATVTYDLDTRRAVERFLRGREWNDRGDSTGRHAAGQRGWSDQVRVGPPYS